MERVGVFVALGSAAVCLHGCGSNDAEGLEADTNSTTSLRSTMIPSTTTTTMLSDTNSTTSLSSTTSTLSTSMTSDSNGATRYVLPAIPGSWQCASKGYNCQSASDAFGGGGACCTSQEHVYACVDWSVGSQLWITQQSVYKTRTGEDVVFGVGTFGSQNSDMGKCFRLEVEGMSSPLIVQSVNTGSDVSSGQFDLQQMAGGVGLCNALTSSTTFADGESTSGSALFPMFSGDNTVWGPKRDGGFSDESGCDAIPMYPDGTAAVSSFPNGESDLRTMCKAAYDLKARRNDGINPTITSGARVACPEEVYKITGVRLTSDDSFDPVTFSGGSLTRMFDGCKPSAGWESNVQGADSMYPAVLPCGPDGITRLSV